MDHVNLWGMKAVITKGDINFLTYLFNFREAVA